MVCLLSTTPSPRVPAGRLVEPPAEHPGVIAHGAQQLHAPGDREAAATAAAASPALPAAAAARARAAALSCSLSASGGCCGSACLVGGSAAAPSDPS